MVGSAEENLEKLVMATRESSYSVYYLAVGSLRPQAHPIEMSLLTPGCDEEDEDYDED